MKIIFILLFFLVYFNIFGKSPYVVFINPGTKNDPFFSRMNSFLKAASTDLKIDLKVLYAERDYFKTINIGKKILSEKNKLPDYLILINEYNMGEYLLPKLDKLGVKVILINEGFPQKNKTKFSKPKEIFKNWILEYLPNDFEAGYLLAKELIEKAIKDNNIDKNGNINLVAILGNPRTTSSVLRKQGLEKAVKEYKGKVKILQMLNANWDTERAQVIAEGFLKRYEDISIIWSASDSMALGAQNALKKLKIKRKVLLGGIDWTLFSFEKVQNSEFVATVGGHFMDAAWALIMAYDDFNGITISESNNKSNFYVINKNNINLFKNFFNKNDWDSIDFKNFSLFLNKSQEKYNFSYAKVIEYLQNADTLKSIDKNKK